MKNMKKGKAVIKEITFKEYRVYIVSDNGKKLYGIFQSKDVADFHKDMINGDIKAMDIDF